MNTTNPMKISETNGSELHDVDYDRVRGRPKVHRIKTLFGPNEGQGQDNLDAARAARSRDDEGTAA